LRDEGKERKKRAKGVKGGGTDETIFSERRGRSWRKHMHNLLGSPTAHTLSPSQRKNDHLVHVCSSASTERIEHLPTV
jgi:hypothetical protein